MYISHKNNVLLKVAETEWDCRMQSKGMLNDEYWAWIDTITSGNPPETTYPSEDFTILEITDENVSERLFELSEYISNEMLKETFNIKVYKNKKNGSHFEGDDTAKDKRLLDEEWVRIRTERTRLLAETDHLALSDQTLSGDMATYRKKLRELPSDQSSKTKYSDITWPTKP